MRYIEEINSGDIFIWKNKRYVLSSDYKPFKNGKTRHMSVSIDNGTCKWFASDELVEVAELFYRDKEGNILLVKEFKDDSAKNKNISLNLYGSMFGRFFQKALKKKLILDSRFARRVRYV